MENIYGYPQTYGNGFMPNFQPQMQQQMMQPQNVNAITEEEMNFIKQSKPDMLDINVSQADNIISMCTHKHNGMDMVQQVSDGTGDVWCPICNQRWTPTSDTSEDEVKNLIEKLVDHMQTSKWVGDLPTELVRDYYSMIPLLNKFPDIYKYAMRTFNKYLGTTGYTDANEASIYAQYNRMMHNSPMYPVYPQQPTMQPNMQPMQQAPMMQPNMQPMQQTPMMQPAPMVNPMQTPYGVSPNPVNNQFVNQADMMMGNTVYGQPPIGYQPAAAQVQQQAQAQAQQPAQEAAAPAEGAKATEEVSVQV